MLIPALPKLVWVALWIVSICKLELLRAIFRLSSKSLGDEKARTAQHLYQLHQDGCQSQQYYEQSQAM